MTSAYKVKMLPLPIVLLLCLLGFGQPNASGITPGGLQSSTHRDGQHDFDFEVGAWKTHLKRLVHPLTGSNTWVEYDGTSVVRKVWNGGANLLELEVDGPNSHIEALSLRLYNPQSHQWSLNFASSAGGTLGIPTVGEFNQGRGEFFDRETLNGRMIDVRFVISDITSNSCHFEQAFSDDGGKTWEVNWIATDTRVTNEPAAVEQNPPTNAAARDGQSDFDFAIGSWKTHLTRRLHPLTGSTTWIEYEGTAVVRKVWHGRANLEEFEADGPAGHIEGLTLRLYNPESHQWSDNWATSNDGTISRPMIGEFKNGRGESYDQEPFNDRAIFVRWVWSDVTPASCRFEQAFSDDGGKTWETNWINTYKRVEN